MTAPPLTTDGELGALSQAATSAGLAAGLVACGVASAGPFDEARQALDERKAAGLAATMEFTYRNPARSTDPARIVPGAAALVVGAWPYAAAQTEPAEPNHGRVARYAWRDYYGELRGALEASASVLRNAGWVARVVADDNALVDRAAAYRAGIGWYGKNANILIKGHGSWVVLGAVVTDAPLPVRDRTVDDGCGPCSRCVAGCPTQAIVAPGVVDARRCLAWLVQAPGSIPNEFRIALGDRIYGCDDCQEVCPPNRRAGGSEPAERPSVAWVGLLEVLAAPDDVLLARHGRWYISGRDPRYLRRNALVALGNVASPADQRVRTAVRAFAIGADAMLAEHARWAEARLDERAWQ